jgi:hypothetical protein
MTAAYRLKGAGWLIACVAVVLGFYLVSLRVAAERKKLEQLDARIALAQRDIRALETEFDTRANLAQLERWNGDTLALAAPTAGQFVRSGAALAAIDVLAPVPLPANAGGATAVRSAALVVPAAVVPAAAPVALAAATPAPAPRTAAAKRAAPVAAAPLAGTVIRVAAMHAVSSPAVGSKLARLAGVEHGHSAALSPSRTVAMLDSKLLSDATLGDLLAKARHEASGRGGRGR